MRQRQPNVDSLEADRRTAPQSKARDVMSHVPLLSRQSVPKLQSPRRGPQVLCLCLVVTVVLLVMPRNAFDALVWNATHVPDPPPQALGRIVNAAARHDTVTSETLDDLLATVGYLAKRELPSR